jgi:hypothetical protein
VQRKSKRGAGLKSHTTGRIGANSYAGKSGGKTAALQALFQFAEPDVAIADWVIVVLQGEREFFRSRGVRRPHVVAGGAGQLAGTLIFCYTVPVEKCVQKAGDSSRFFCFRHLLIGFRAPLTSL